jgi:hypothetical protein
MSSDLIDQIRKHEMWGRIHRLAEKDPYIKELLDKIVVYYKVKYEQRRR